MSASALLISTREYTLAESHGVEPSPLDEAMERYVDGDLNGFDELYAGLSPRVFAFLMTLVRERSRAEDLLQQTFLKLHSARGAWVRGARIVPYVLAIARNAAFDQFRSRSKARVVLTGSGEIPDVAVEPRSSQDDELATALERAIEQLPANYREAILLTKKLELSTREAAEVTGSTEMAMKLRVHRAYKRLRLLLDEYAPEGTAR